MLIAAWIALFKDDLKAILAFSTVSQLGLMTMLLGFGTAAAAVAAVFHILNHATFKAALFMSAGAIDHEAGTRHIHRLGGLADADADHRDAVVHRRGGDGRNPAVERLSVEGDDAGGGVAHGLSRAAAGCFRCWRPLAALLSAAYSFRFAIGTFLGPARHDYPHHPHDPPAGHVAAGCGAGSADRRDRRRAADGRRPDRRAHRAGGGRRRAATVRAGAVARLHAQRRR